jgi:hypothetical protein
VGGLAEEVAAAVAVRAASVFLLWLPRGRPRLRGTNCTTAGLLPLLRLPSGQPRLRPPNLPDPPALSDPAEDMAEAGAREKGEGGSAKKTME